MTWTWQAMLSKSTLVAFAVECRWDIHTNHHKKYNGNPEKMWRFISKTGGIFTNAASIHPQKCARHPLVFDEPCLILGDDEWMASRHFFHCRSFAWQPKINNAVFSVMFLFAGYIWSVLFTNANSCCAYERPLRPNKHYCRINCQNTKDQ